MPALVVPRSTATALLVDEEALLEVVVLEEELELPHPAATSRERIPMASPIRRGMAGGTRPARPRFDA